MNSDHGIVTNYTGRLELPRVEAVRRILHDIQEDLFHRFLDAVTDSVLMYRAHRAGEANSPNVKDQQRFFGKLQKAIKRVSEDAANLDTLLSEAPFELRRKARDAKVPIEQIQSSLTIFSQTVHEFTPSKTRSRIGVPEPAIRKAFRDVLGVEPVAKSFSRGTNCSNCPLPESIDERYIMVLASLFDISLDWAYRVARRTT